MWLTDSRVILRPVWYILSTFKYEGWLSCEQMIMWMCFQHFVSLLVKQYATFKWKLQFKGFLFRQVVQEHLLNEAFLIAYFLSNVCAKIYQNKCICFKVTARQRWDVLFETQCILQDTLAHLKDRIGHEEKLKVIYKIPCENCDRVKLKSTWNKSETASKRDGKCYRKVLQECLPE